MTGRRDAGSGSIWLLGLGLAVIALASAAVAASGVLVTRHRAQAAADLAALGGAARSADGPALACGYAKRIAQADGARLVDCHLTGVDLTVVVEIGLPGAPGMVRATARAGPPRALGRGRVLVTPGVRSVIAFCGEAGQRPSGLVMAWPASAMGISGMSFAKASSGGLDSMSSSVDNEVVTHVADTGGASSAFAVDG